MIELLLLEPDFWRFTAIQHVAERSGQVRLIGEVHFERILTLKRAPADLNPSIVMLAHRLILDHGIALIPHLRDLFRGTRVLVFGEDDRLDRIAEMLAVGARGYFPMSAPPRYLGRALQVVCDGKIWAPREAVALMAHGGEALQTESSQADIDERNLLHLLCRGLSNKEIAARFGLAEVTIKARMSRLYRKYGVRTRVQLFAVVVKRGLIDADDDPDADVAIVRRRASSLPPP